MHAGIALCSAGAVIAGSIALASIVDRPPAACPPGSEPARSLPTGREQGDGHGDTHGQGQGHEERLVVGPTCNLVEMVVPWSSRYRPDVGAASRTDRARAQRLLQGVNEFCDSTSASEVMTTWVPADSKHGPPTHYFNPDRRGSSGLDPSNPRAALIYGQRIEGVMFTGAPLPHLGSIPRAHTHDASRPQEMLHVYCADELMEAFTPSRPLGVLADSIALRKDIRQRVAHLVDPGLTAVLRDVRGYVLGQPRGVRTDASATPEKVDPVVWAKRVEIRQSLVLLTEPQLRNVLRQVKAATKGRAER